MKLTTNFMNWESGSPLILMQWNSHEAARVLRLMEKVPLPVETSPVRV
jgi:hypothetical protein